MRFVLLALYLAPSALVVALAFLIARAISIRIVWRRDETSDSEP